MIRHWRKISPETRLGAWALDEAKAYRQIPLAPDQRRFGVVAVVDPGAADKPVSRTRFFVLNGHAFGFANAVYNYCRGPLALHRILTSLFWIVGDHYGDDRWGIEPMSTIKSSFETSSAVMSLLGITTQAEQDQGPQQEPSVGNPNPAEPWTRPELLGFILDLDRMEVQIKPQRRERLLAEIAEIRSSGRLTPGQASKLRGKLQFTTCSLFGRTGRAQMRPLSERQYQFSGKVGLNGPLRSALKAWEVILQDGRPRPIPEATGGPADAVLFTDGAANRDGSEPTIGGAAFAWWFKSPKGFAAKVPSSLRDRWVPRKSQITLIELFATVVALDHFGPAFTGKRVVLMIDSEAALDALVKGHSRTDDVCELVSVLWQIVARHQVLIYLDKVATDSNIADGLPRFKLDES